MAEKDCITEVNINGESRKIKDPEAVTKAEFEQTIGSINSIVDNINGEEV